MGVQAAFFPISRLIDGFADSGFDSSKIISYSFPVIFPSCAGVWKLRCLKNHLGFW